LIFVIVTLIFSFIHLVPGDPAELLLSGSGGAAPSIESIRTLRHALHLDEPLIVQYGDYLGKLAHFDLGRSIQDNHQVSSDIATRLPRTLELIITAVILAVLAGIPAGVIAATHRSGIVDVAISVAVSAGIALPVFVLGTILVLIFALAIPLVPAGGYVNFVEDPGKHIRELILPSITIAFGLTAIVARMMRSSVLEVLGRDWVRTARAKGLAETAVLRRHVVRNSLGPVITVVGLQMGSLLGGTVLVEYIFNWPGLSGLLVQATSQRDYPVVQGIVLVISVLFILLNLAVDLAYSLLDPRVRYE
jgi:ABC-type dipeptide/oligopeptide/nickel transport system permease component